MIQITYLTKNGKRILGTEALRLVKSALAAKKLKAQVTWG
jgi:hypothetical protein